MVVGAGAAGLLAAARAAERGLRTLLLEKNRKPGVKILMSGGTRCNLTHATDARGIIEAFGRPGRFLHSALARLAPPDLVEIFHREGLRTKVEPTGKIFPASDRALDVLAALLVRLKRSGAVLACEEPLLEIGGPDSEGFRLVTPRRTIRAASLLLTTGGRSYPRCGTTGDGYAWAAAWGHAIVPPRPALVPLRTDASWVTSLTGLTVHDVLVRILPGADPGGPDSSTVSGGPDSSAAGGPDSSAIGVPSVQEFSHAGIPIAELWGRKRAASWPNAAGRSCSPTLDCRARPC